MKAGVIRGVSRRVDLLRQRPREIVDRFWNKIEFAREPSSVVLTHEQVIERAAERYDYHVDADWFRALHAALGAECCDVDGPFNMEWQSLAAEVGAPYGLDADEAFARSLFCLASHLRPTTVVETGVARGVSSRFFLQAMETVGTGHLWSIDLPPLTDGLTDQGGALVPERLRHRWTFLRGSSRRLLPSLLREVRELDIFVHDSQHTERNMIFELDLAWQHLRPGGVVVADDIHENGAFRYFLDTTGAMHLIAQEDQKAGLFGIAFKP